MEVEHQNLYGGSGIIRIAIVDVELVSPFKSVLRYKVEPVASIGLHQHQVDSTLLICISGQGTVVVNGSSFVLVAHETLMVPCKAQVSIHNPSDGETFEFWMVRGRK